MYKIKQKPEDFIVKEIAGHELDEDGNYTYFILKKRNYNTLDAVKLLSKFLRIPIRYIGFAGTKDKTAVSEQVCSVYRVPQEKLERLRLKDIELIYIGKGKKPISLGDLRGNKFKIVVRNLSHIIKRKTIIARKIPNYFGKQRFSKNNIDIGKYIVKRNFQKSVELINQKEVKFYIEDNPGDFAGALRNIPLKLRKLYIHAYQSYIWNKTVEEYMKTKPLTNEKIPIVGFSTELLQNTIGKIIRKILLEEGINQRDFIIKAIPELSSEGGERNLFIMPEDFFISEPEEDELNKNKFKIILQFTLPKGSYATTVIEDLFSLL